MSQQPTGQPEPTQGYGEPQEQGAPTTGGGWGGYGQPAYGQGPSSPPGGQGGQPAYGQSPYAAPAPAPQGSYGAPYGQSPYGQKTWGQPAYGQGSPYAGATRSQGSKTGLSTLAGAGGLLVVLGYLVAVLGVIAAIAALTVTGVGGGYVVESFAHDLLLGLGLGGLCIGLGQLLKARAASSATTEGGASSAASSTGTTS